MAYLLVPLSYIYKNGNREEEKVEHFSRSTIS